MLIRLAFGVSLTFATCLLFTDTGKRALARPGAYRTLQIAFAASRLLGWSIAYVALADFTRFTDLVLYYYPEAAMAASGRLPYRDFPTSYGLLFPYVSGAFLAIWASPAAVALVMVLAEILAVLALASSVRQDRHMSQGAASWLMAVYLLNPAALYWSGMMAYNSSIILLCWVMAARVLVAGRYATSMVWLAVSVLAGKVLGVVVAPVWVAHPARRHAALAWAAGAAIVIWLAGRRMDIDLALPLLREGNRSTAGNVWFLFGWLLPMSPDGMSWRLGAPLALAVAAGGLASWLAVKWRDAPQLRQLCGAMSALGWLFLVMSKKSYPHYAPMFLLLTVATLCDGRSGTARWALILALVGTIGVVEPGLWNALGQPQSFLDVAPTGAGAIPLALADVGLITGAVLLCVASARVAATRH